MTIQQKHVSVNVAAFSSSRFLAGLAGLSPVSTVVLFRLLVIHDETVNPKSEPGRELVRHGFCSPFGSLSPWVAEHMGAAIELLLAEAGADLLPQDHPTSITELGHNLVKGRSKTSRKVRAAEAIMRNTAFTIDRGVLALASSDFSLSQEDRLVLAVIHAGLVPDEFYFPISYDYRGRMYYRGGVLTPQGSDLLKGLIRFAEPAPLGKHGKFALCMALADALGIKDAKRSAMEKVLASDLPAIAQGSNGFMAAQIAGELLRLQAHEAQGNPADTFMSAAVCHQDATCSGLQIAAAITGHRATAEATNCTASTPDVPRRDIYADVTRDIATAECELSQHARTFGRALLKKAVMTLGYGAGRETLKKSVTEYLGDHDVEWVWDERSEWFFFDSLERHCGATTYLKDQLMLLAQRAGEAFEWETHDGFRVVHDKRAGEEVRLGKFVMEFDIEWDLDSNITAIAPNFVHSLDAAQMREAVRMLNCPVACIHDSLGTRAGDYVNAARAVRVSFHTIEAQRICRELLAQHGITLGTLGDYRPAEACDSSYFWC
jgi:hypothetical protein